LVSEATAEAAAYAAEKPMKSSKDLKQPLSHFIGF
jgi:hypothetical protein